MKVLSKKKLLKQYGFPRGYLTLGCLLPSARHTPASQRCLLGLRDESSPRSWGLLKVQ